MSSLDTRNPNHHLDDEQLLRYADGELIRLNDADPKADPLFAAMLEGIAASEAEQDRPQQRFVEHKEGTG